MYFVILIVVGAFLWYISKQTIKKPLQTEGKSILRLNPIFGFVGIVCMAIGLLLPFMFWIQDGVDAADLLITITLFVILFGMGYWIYSWSRHHKVIFDDREVVVVTSKKTEKRFKWSDVVEVKLNPWTSKYILTLKSNETVHVHQYLTGVEEFLERVRSVS